MSKAYIIAITGGSCSGKTTLVNRLRSLLGDDRCSVVFQDSYYLGLNSITNFDHLDAIDFNLMREHLGQLKKGYSIDMPCYDFSTHRRKAETEPLIPTQIILVDGILILASDVLRDSFDLTVFVECDEQVRRDRRIKRDVAERGRKYTETLLQFDNQVVPAHNRFVEPSRQYADFIFSQESIEANNGSIDMLKAHCEEIINAV